MKILKCLLLLSFSLSSRGQGTDSSWTGTSPRLEQHCSQKLVSGCTDLRLSKPHFSTGLQMSRDVSNMRALHFRAPACINQSKLGYAVTKNTRSRRLTTCLFPTLQVQGESAGGSVLHTHHLSDCGKKWTVKSCTCFPGPPGNWLEVVTYPCQGSWETEAHNFGHNNTEESPSKFYWKTTSREQLLSSSHPSRYGDRARPRNRKLLLNQHSSGCCWLFWPKTAYGCCL